MKVQEFMVPAADVATVTETDKIATVIDLMLSKHISAVVVVQGQKAVAVVSKTDIVKAYKLDFSKDAEVKDIMSKELFTVDSNHDRDRAARSFEANKTHHAVVVDDDGNFAGFISAWDIAKECVLDDRAWPWIRQKDGKLTPY